MEYPSVAACRFETNRINLINWLKVNNKNISTIVTSEKIDPPSWSASRCIQNVPEDSIIRIPPNHENIKKKGVNPITRPSSSSNNSRTNHSIMQQQNSHYFPKWISHHFHEEFYYNHPSGKHTKTDCMDGIVLLFEAMARECIAVCISSEPNYVPNESMYQIILGANGNTTTLMKVNLARRKYDDEKNKNKTTIQQKGIITSTQGRVCQEKSWTSYWILLDERNHKLYVGIGTIPGEKCISVYDTHQTSTMMSDDCAPRTDHAANTGKEDDNNSKDTTEETKTILLSGKYYIGISNSAHYDRQAPAPIKVRKIILTSLPIELADQLHTTIQLNQLEMITVDKDEAQTHLDGNHIDDRTILDATLLREYKEECDKARARAIKFGISYQEPPPDAFIPWSHARRLRANPTTGFITGMDLTDPTEQAKITARKTRFGAVTTSSLDSTEPPEQQQLLSSEHDQDATPQSGPPDDYLPMEQAWDNESFILEQRVDPHPSLWKEPGEIDPEAMDDTEDALALVPEKIHIFSIDWAAFKQIRTDDIMSYFSIYGPSYVEWLADLSCNIHFQDKYSAKRALENMSMELPSPPPLALIESDAVNENHHQPMYGPSDLGNMGWRLGKMMLRKISKTGY
jgi:Nuclear cap-binding protein subunit 3